MFLIFNLVKNFDFPMIYIQHWVQSSPKTTRVSGTIIYLVTILILPAYPYPNQYVNNIQT